MKRTQSYPIIPAKKRCPECPCGGGQSCIVMRRYCEDWVHEDDLFKEANVPLRENCYCDWTEAQQKVMDNFREGFDSATTPIIVSAGN